MEAFGYDENDKDFEKLINLSQVTINFKKEELDDMLDFLNMIKDECENENTNKIKIELRNNQIICLCKK